MPKEYELQVGMQNNLQPATVKVPDTDPRPWDGKDTLKYIGNEVPRVDGKAKTTGSAKYTIDIQLPGMLYAKFLRSNKPAAKIHNIDTTRAEKMPGVKAILLVNDKFPFAVRHQGQEILAVAAETLQQAKDALNAIEVEYEELPFVSSLEEAMKPGAPSVFPENVQQKDKVTEGDVGTGTEKNLGRSGNVRNPSLMSSTGGLQEVQKLLAESAMQVSAKFRTQVQTHSAMEPHGAVAHWEDEEHLTVWASTQSTFSVRGELAVVFKLPQTNVRVFTEYMGGGFGAKFGAGAYGVMAARLARQTKSPVHLVLDRKEEHLAGGNRPDSLQEVKIGATKEGLLTAIYTTCFGTSGVGTGAGASAPFRALYDCERFYTAESDVFTNASPGAAFRAPGHPQGIFALEQVIDALAYQLSMDPLEFRKINTKRHEARQLEYQIGAERFGWNKRNPKAGAMSGPIKRGVGVANSLWYYIYGTGFQASVKVYSDGSVELNNGVQDIGTGIRTAITMVVAEELGLKVSEVVTRIGDTTLGYGPASGGSQTTAGLTPAVRNAAFLAKRKMLEIAASLLNASVDAIELADGRFFVRTEPSKNMTWKQVAAKIPGDQFTVIGERATDYFQPQVPGYAYAQRGSRGSMALIAGVQFVEIEVDTETGVIRVLRVTAVHDCGHPMNRLTTRSQIQGGVIQGISYALFEDRILDRNTGLMVNPNFEQYKISGSLDTPPIEVIILDEIRGINSTSAKGIGEPATVPTAAAIANAFYHATGVRIYELPMTPENVLTALESAERGGK